MTNFCVGQKVEFVGAGNYGRLPRKVMVPEKNVIYTIRDLYIDPTSKEVGLHLREITNQPEPFVHPAGSGLDGWEMGWLPAEFSPIVEAKTDISVFLRMLHPEKEPAT